METEKNLKDTGLTFWVKFISTSMFVLYWTILMFIPLRPSLFWLQIIGSAGWVWAGIKWKEPTLIAMHGFVGVMSIISLFQY